MYICVCVCVCQDGLVVNMPANYVVGHEFAPLPGHTRDRHKNGMAQTPPIFLIISYILIGFL